MPKKTGKRRDINELAFSLVQRAADPNAQEADTRNPAAVALGQLGGSKGGKARARKLSKAQRKAIAEKAARARWGR